MFRFFIGSRGCSEESILSVLKKAFEMIKSQTRIETIVAVAAYLGKSNYSKIVKEIAKKHSNYFQKGFDRFPSPGPRSLFSPNLIDSYRLKKKGTTFKKEILKKLNDIAKNVIEKNISQPSVMDRRLAISIDCELYAQEDKYKIK